MVRPPYRPAVQLGRGRGQPRHDEPGVLPDGIAPSLPSVTPFDRRGIDYSDLTHWMIPDAADHPVDDRNLDVPKSFRNQIARKLERTGIAPMRTATINAFMPVRRIDSTALYGEALPPGLVLAVDPDCER